MNINFKRILVGLCVIIVSFVVFGGDEGLTFLMASVICTAGASLAIYIPVALAIGILIEAMAAFMGFNLFKKNDTKDQKKSLTPNQMALVNYIGECKERGIAPDTFYASLNASGWTNDEITEAMNYAQNNSTQ